MHFISRTTLALIWGALASIGATLVLGGQDTGQAELQTLLARALKGSPRILASRERVGQALDRHEELLGFYDPSLYAAAGKAERARGVPGGSGWLSLGSNAQELQGGVEVPFRPGAYLTVGAAERFLFDDTDYDHLYQSLLGLRLRIPLGRDRGFIQWELQRARALADYNSSISELITVMQAVRRDVELGYITAYETLASYQVACQSTERFETLLGEARELARLKVVPSYQVYPAEMQLASQQEDQESARQVHQVSLIQLQGAIGDGQPVTLGSGPERLVEEAGKVANLPEASIEEALGRQGAYLRVLNGIEAARADLARARDDLQPDISLNAGVTWQGEDPNQPLGGRALRSDHGLGVEIVVVWERPLRYRAEKSRASWHRARIAELKQNLQDIRVSTNTRLGAAAQAYGSLVARLKLIEQVIGAASKALEAEGERFRLGEGRSRNVLDAEKDLTSALLRRTRAAADLLRAHADYRYAAGYPDVE